MESKSLLIIALSLVFAGLVMFAGCKALDSSPIAKAVFNIAVRSAVYEIAKSNPSSIGGILNVATFLKDIKTEISPAQLELDLDRILREANLDPIQLRNANDVADLAVAGYRQLFEKYEDKLDTSQTIEVLQNIGQAVYFGAVPSTDGSAEFISKGRQLVVVVD